MSQHHRAKGWTTAKATKARDMIKATLPRPCVDCKKPVLPTQRWQVGHIRPISKGGSNEPHNLGPSHTRCNLSAGGKLGAQAQGKAVATPEKREFKW